LELGNDTVIETQRAKSSTFHAIPSHISTIMRSCICKYQLYFGLQQILHLVTALGYAFKKMSAPTFHDLSRGCRKSDWA